MTFLSPLAFLLTLLAVPLVSLYVLRLRRPDREVSSIMLWPRIVGDMQANAPWQRLRPSVLLVLQLVALLTLVIALARPAYSRTASVSGDLIVILDQSYSMQAHDVHPSRFVLAQNRALALASGLANGHVMSVIGMGRQPHLVIAASSDRSSIERSLQALRPESSTPNVLAAFSLAASLTRQAATTRVVVFTDHNSAISGVPMSVPFPVDVVRFGGIMRDLGIVAFAARSGTATHAVLRMHNFGRVSAASDLKLFADGQLADVRPMQAGPDGDTSATWDGLPAGIHVLEAHLTTRDDMSTDKVAWAVAGSAQQRRVLLVTKGNYFLQTALSLDSSTLVETVRPTAYNASAASRADVIVFDSLLPQQLPPVPVLLLGPPAGRTAGIALGKTQALGSSPITTSLGTDTAAVLRYVDLSDVHVARTRRLKLPIWLRAAATASGQTVLALGERGAQRVAVVPFRLQESDWPLRVSFPVVIRNLLEYLAPGTIAATPSVAAGSPIALIPPARTRELLIRRPDGSTDRVLPPFPPYGNTALSGVYRVWTVPAGVASVSFAVNSFAHRRPDAPGASALHLGRRGTIATRQVSEPVGFEWAFGLLALGILSLEWWVGLKR